MEDLSSSSVQDGIQFAAIKNELVCTAASAWSKHLLMGALAQVFLELIKLQSFPARLIIGVILGLIPDGEAHGACGGLASQSHVEDGILCGDAWNGLVACWQGETVSWTVKAHVIMLPKGESAQLLPQTSVTMWFRQQFPMRPRHNIQKYQRTSNYPKKSFMPTASRRSYWIKTDGEQTSQIRYVTGMEKLEKTAAPAPWKEWLLGGQQGMCLAER